jgi:hypothetical protein
LPCTSFDGWACILDFYLLGFSSSDDDANINMVWGPEKILDTWLHITNTNISFTPSSHYAKISLMNVVRQF